MRTLNIYIMYINKILDCGGATRQAFVQYLRQIVIVCEVW